MLVIKRYNSGFNIQHWENRDISADVMFLAICVIWMNWFALFFVG